MTASSLARACFMDPGSWNITLYPAALKDLEIRPWVSPVVSVIAGTISKKTWMPSMSDLRSTHSPIDTPLVVTRGIGKAGMNDGRVLDGIKDAVDAVIDRQHEAG